MTNREHVAAADGETMKRTVSGLAIAVLVLAATAPAHAQPRGSQSTDSAFQFRLGGFFPSGGGELWNNNEQDFTMSVGDFDDGAIGFTYVAGMSNNLEIGFNLDFYDSTVRSSYRDYVDQDGYAILHDTRLQLMPATVDLRILPGGRYSNRGTRSQYRVHHPVPYLGIGAGFNFWRYEETGDFVDFGAGSADVFSDHFSDSGVAFEAHVLAGIELPMGPNWNLLFEGRYSWSEVTPSGDLAGLGSLEIGGTSAFIGAAFHF
jgi:hypothetical protein